MGTKRSTLSRTYEARLRKAMSGKALVVVFASASIAGLLLGWLIVLAGERYIANGSVGNSVFEAGEPSCVDETFVEHDGELGLRLGPLARWSFPFGRGAVQTQIQQFGRGVIGRKVASGPHGAAQF